MIQSDITAICQRKSKRSDATSLSNLKLALVEATDWLSDEFVINSGVPIDCLKTAYTFTIADGDYQKALPADFVSLLDDNPPTLIDGCDETELTKKTPIWFTENYPVQSHASATKEDPQYFHIEGGYIKYNKSDGAYSIKLPYAKRHETIVGDSTVILFPDIYKNLLAYLTLAFFFDDLDNEDQKTKYLKLSQTELAKLGLINKRNNDVSKNTKYNDL